MSSRAFFIEAAANTVSVLSSAAAAEKAAPDRMRKAIEIPARRTMMALRAGLRGAFARANRALVGSGDATIGSAVPAVSCDLRSSGRSRGRAYSIVGTAQSLGEALGIS